MNLADGNGFDGLDGPEFGRDNFVKTWGDDLGNQRANVLDYAKGLGGFVKLFKSGMPYDQAIAQLKTYEPQGGMDYEKESALFHRAEENVKHGLAGQVADVKNGIEDAAAQAHVGMGIDTSIYNRANLVNKMGEENGSRVSDVLDAEQKFGAVNDESGTMLRAINELPPDEQAKAYALTPQAGPGFKEKYQLYKQAVGGLLQAMEIRNKDPMQWAVYARKADPLNMTNADALSNSIHARIDVDQELRQDYNTRGGILSKQEADTIAKVLDDASPDVSISYLQAIQRGTSYAPGAYQRVMAQIAPKAPLVAMAGSLSVQEGSVTVGNEVLNGRDVARRLFEGNNILQRASLDGEKKLPLPIKIDDKQFKLLYRQQSPISAFWAPDTDYSEQRDAIGYAATKAYLVSQMYHEGKDSFGADDVKNAVRAVSGGFTYFNGNQIAIPWGMDENKFIYQMPYRIQQAIDDAGWKDSELDLAPSLRLVEFNDGKYGLANDNRLLVDRKTGDTVVIDASKPLPPEVQAAMDASNSVYNRVLLRNRRADLQVTF
ncbi:MAG: hypothetical protein LBQ20_02955 [Rhodanobacter sp.]|nr:hypothetical protein [Rhodanobacter sp.]